MFNNAQMIEIDGKEVKSIVLQDGGVLYENIIDEPLILHFTGQEFQSNAPLIGKNIVIDWGDGTTTNYNKPPSLQHTYNENAEHIITISGITELSTSFSGISGITDVIIPNTITSIANGAFSSTQISNIIIPSSVTSMGQTVFEGTPIKDICLLWDSSETIVPYQAITYQGISSDNYTIHIPKNTTRLYISKGYPLEKLIEGATSITLTSDKDIVGIGETAIITGTLNYPSQGETVTFNIGTESVTVLTDSNGQATMEYEGVGAGDAVITGTYSDKNVSDTITITNVVAHDVGYGSYLLSSKYLSRTIENNGVLITDSHPDSESEFSEWYMYILPNNQHPTSMSECNIWESDKNYYVEMDIIDSDASNSIQFRPKASGEFIHKQEISQLSNSTPFHLKIIISGGISYWFVDDDDYPIYIENSIDLGESYGIRIAMMKQQSLKFNNLIVYELDESFIPPVQPTPSSISIQSNKTVISATNNESCILNATVLDEDTNPIQNQEVTFKLGTTILDTTLTDENGEATYEFEAKGNGNISVSAEVGELSSNSLTIEDCIYAKMQQYDIVRSGSTVYGLLNDDIISDLPTQYSIEYSMKTSKEPSYGAEHRLYWVPRELYNNGNQPTYAMFLGFAYTPIIQYGVRRGGNTSCVDKTCSIDSWYNFRVDKLSDRFNYYNNGSFIDWYSFGYQYNNWTFSYILWSDTTFSVKNIKIKPFEFNATISIEYSETETNYTLTATLTGNDIVNRAVRFYKNNKYIGTSFTDSNGIATKTFNEIENEDMSFTAWCGNVESSEVIVENDINTPKIQLSADKNILSYADNDSCILTAIYKNADSVSGKSVVFKVDDTILDTVTTDNEGVATYEYESQGAGDVTITVECMNLQGTCELEDCKYFNDGSSIGSLWIGNGVGCTSNGNYITITTNTSGEKYVNLPVNIMDGDEFSFELAEFGVIQDMAWQIYNARTWGGTYDTDCSINLEDSSASHYEISRHIGQVLSIQYQNGVCSVYFDGDLKKSKTVYLNNSNAGFYTNNGGVQHIKNIKLKPLSVKLPEQEENTPLPTILYSNDGTKTDLQLPNGGTCTTNGEYLTLGDAYNKRFMLPVTLNGDWGFSFDLKSQALFNLVVDNVEVVDGNLRNAGTIIKLVCEQGIAKMYANDTLINSNNISSSNYSIGIKSSVTSFSLDNLQVKRLGE